MTTPAVWPRHSRHPSPRLGGQDHSAKRLNLHQDRYLDFSAILTKVAESKAEVLFLPDYYNIVNLVGAQAKEKGVTAVMMGGDGWDSSDLDVAAAEGGFYSNHYDPGDTRPIVQDGLKWSHAAYQNKYEGKPPTLWRPSVMTPPTC